MEANDVIAMKELMGGNAMSPYEQFKVGNIQSRSHTSGIGVAGLVLGCVGTAAAIGAWIFAPLYGNAKAGQAREVAQAAKEQATLLSAGTQRQLDQLTSLFAAERAERITGDTNISQTITDTISGQQSASQSQQTSVDNTISQVMSQTFSDAVRGRSSLNPTPVSLYSAPQPCGCPGSCGCNG